MFGIFTLLVLAVLANFFSTIIGGRPEAWIATLILFIAMLVIAGWAVKRKWDGVFIDKDNRISLSRFQLIVWTVLLVSALFTAGLTNAAPPDVVVDPLNITIPPQIWALLGLGTFTAVAAPAIKEGKRDAAGPTPAAPARAQAAAQQDTVALVQKSQGLTAAPRFDGRVLAKATSADSSWLDLIMGDYEGSAFVDVSKLQKLAFTVLVVVVYGMGLWQVMVDGGAVIRNFPPVDTGLLALLGISHAAYLADKQIAAT
jgi:hypothetical protein